MPVPSTVGDEPGTGQRHRRSIAVGMPTAFVFAAGGFVSYAVVAEVGPDSGDTDGAGTDDMGTASAGAASAGATCVGATAGGTTEGAAGINGG